MDENMLKDLLREKKLILTCGSGGVGKTTTAAALALKAALAGRKVMVLTIDPARRLATSLGLEALGAEPKRISPLLIERATGIKNVKLFAMMLDTKSTFDHLVSKYAPSKEVEKKILNNKIYQHLSDMIAGSQEYMAMEKLYEVVVEGNHDLVVVDTPPTVHAIDFLEAPERMISAIGHSMIHLLLKPAMLAGKSGFKLFEKGSRFILKIFDRITGFAFLQDISEMLLSFQDLLSGFKERAAEVKKILTDADTSFVLVSAHEDKSILEARYFIERLSEMSLPLGGVILNRGHPLYTISADQKKKDLHSLDDLVGLNATKKMMRAFEQFECEARQDAVFQKETASLLSEKKFLVSVPLFESDIHDLEGLQRLGEYLN